MSSRAPPLSSHLRCISTGFSDLARISHTFSRQVATLMFETNCHDREGSAQFT